ncbi:Crp/Fnr family transcriptional regulator [Actinophytocola sp.]|uniref:Crp/Fnr family transcriptional regulator n=1 Tax=Actinophytocola sp. TaxID=1872138 RepID=UPI002D5995DA|nr:Crp/Fnr family transcriptional regulator [Actinophytocola sp.]HYQ67906.1 Crp/Fnr family transcriptional regulator [Actinophytocola sp.]
MTREPLVGGSFLHYLAPPDRDFLLGRGMIHVRSAGRTLMHEGDPTDHVLVLLSGWVRVYTTARNGQVVLYALCGPGEVIGDLAALHGWPRTATVDTLQETEFAQFTHDGFLACLEDRAALGVALLRQMAVRLRKAEGARVDFATMGVAQRVAAFLVRMADLHGRPSPNGVLVGMPLTQQDIANSIGGSRRAVARALQTFRERGMLVTGRRMFVVSALDVLRGLAGSAPDGT